MMRDYWWVLGEIKWVGFRIRRSLENVGSRHAAICKRRNGLFEKAHAEVGLITISDDGVIHEFASSSMQSIIARFKDGMKSIEGSNPESMKLNDFVLLEEQLNRGLLYIHDRKIQLLMEEVMQEQIMLQRQA